MPRPSSLSLPFTILLPLELTSSQGVTMPRWPTRASHHSGRCNGILSHPSTSRRVLGTQEGFPSSEFGIHPPEPRAFGFFFNSGRNPRFRRRSSNVQPSSDSPLREHPLDSLYLPIPLTCAFLFSRAAAAMTSPCCPWLPSPAQLQSPWLLLTTPVSSPHLPLVHVHTSSHTLGLQHRRTISPPLPTAAHHL